MKNKYYLLIFIFLIANFSKAQNIIYRDTEYPNGSRWTSTNGRFELVYQDGYLVENEISKYGKTKIWQFPAIGAAARPTVNLIFKTFYKSSAGLGVEGAGIPFQGTQDFDYYLISIGGTRWNFSGNQFDRGRAGYIYLQGDGNICITTEKSQPNPVWCAQTSVGELIRDGKYPTDPYVENGGNLFFSKPFREVIDVVYFSMKNITMIDDSTISQDQSSATFAALGFVELNPGFNTAISGNGVFVAQSLLQGEGSLVGKSSSEAISQNGKKAIEEEIPIASSSKFALYPNPTKGTVEVLLDPDDTIKTIQLFDVSGKQVGQYNNVLSFNFSEKPTGLYVYKIETSKALYSGKIIKE